MEKFNHNVYRQETAQKLKEIRKTKDCRSSEEKEQALPAQENDFEVAKTTPEYLFSKTKAEKEKVFNNEIIPYIKDIFLREDLSLDQKFKKSKEELESKNKEGEAYFSNDNYIKDLVLSLENKNILKAESPHVDLMLGKNVENKFVQLDLVSFDKNHPALVFSKKLLERFPELRDLSNYLVEKSGSERDTMEKFGGGNFFEGNDKWEKIYGDVRRFIIENKNPLKNVNTEPDTKTTYIIGRPVISHGFHSVVSTRIADQQILPEIGLEKIDYEQRQKPLDEEKLRQLVKIMNDTSPNRVFKAILPFLKIAGRCMKLNQENPPFLQIKGGGFMSVLEDGSIRVSGTSGDFGIEDRTLTGEILQRELPEHKFVLINE
jgi:hypothetical protein